MTGHYIIDISVKKKKQPVVILHNFKAQNNNLCN